MIGKTAKGPARKMSEMLAFLACCKQRAENCFRLIAPCGPRLLRLPCTRYRASGSRVLRCSDAYLFLPLMTTAAWQRKKKKKNCVKWIRKKLSNRVQDCTHNFILFSKFLYMITRYSYIMKSFRIKGYLFYLQLILLMNYPILRILFIQYPDSRKLCIKLILMHWDVWGGNIVITQMYNSVSEQTKIIPRKFCISSKQTNVSLFRCRKWKLKMPTTKTHVFDSDFDCNLPLSF